MRGCSLVQFSENSILKFSRIFEIGIKRCGILLRIFWCMWKVCRRMSTCPNAHAKVIKWIFELRFPGNWFEFIVIVNGFWSSTIWDIQIEVSFAGFKILKFPKFNLNMPCRYFRLSSRFLHCVDFIICVNFRNYHVQ